MFLPFNRIFQTTKVSIRLDLDKAITDRGIDLKELGIICQDKYNINSLCYAMTGIKKDYTLEKNVQEMQEIISEYYKEYYFQMDELRKINKVKNKKKKYSPYEEEKSESMKTYELLLKYIDYLAKLGNYDLDKLDLIDITLIIKEHKNGK